MPTNNLLYKKRIPINEHIEIVIPTVGEVLFCNGEDFEESYYNLVYSLTAMPIDMMVYLDDVGIDFTEIDAYQLFLLIFDSIKKLDTSLIFGELKLADFDFAENTENGNIVLLNGETGVVIDRAIHEKIADTLRVVHHLEKDNRKPANKEAREFMIERARKKMKRNKNKKTDSNLETLITAMVNTEQYKYDFESTKSLTIYQFNECVKQIIKKVDYDNKMRGVYAGTISPKDLSQDELNWLIHK